jgi:hypothetical protein
MVTTEDIRRFATALPGVEESTHHVFKVPVFRVGGTAFAGLNRGETTAVFSIAHEDAQAAVADDPGTYAEVWRPGGRRSFVGLRVDLSKVAPDHVHNLVERAWRNKAPKRLVAAHDA